MNKILCYCHNIKVELNNIRHVSEYINFTSDYEYFTNSNNYKRVGIIQTPFNDFNCDEIYKILNDWKNVDLIIYYSVELNDTVYELILSYDRKNIIYIINGLLNIELKYAKVYSMMYWLIGSRYFYYNLHPELLLKKHNPYIIKDYKFEIMYGLPRTHRLFVKNIIDNSSTLKSNIYQTKILKYGTEEGSTPLKNIDNEWEDEICFNEVTNDATYYGYEMSISQIIPFKIYKKATYSIVCETLYNNKYSFMTEKISKPIMAERVFIVISGQYYLKNLRKLGFKTFDGIIDESYDNEPDNEKRWTMAMNEVEKLCKKDTLQVLNQCSKILQHNYNHILSLPWNVIENNMRLFIIDNITNQPGALE